MIDSKLIGGILLIVGTSIGAGMLALPVANAAVGFWQSSLILILCWMLMTAGAFYIVQVNLTQPAGTHMISMAGATLGRFGQAITWICYLILLYTLLSAYISGGADVLGSLFAKININLLDWQSAFLFTAILAFIVYAGIYFVDYVNRGLMFAKLGIYLLLIILIAPHVEPIHFLHGKWQYAGPTLMILITSFGFAIIVPNLKDYYHGDEKRLKRAVWIGSLIPLICYIAWDAIIMGALPSEGANNLESLMHSAHTTSSLADMISHTINNPVITVLFNSFVSICMLTAFLGVSLCLFGFLSDGIHLKQRGFQGYILMALTFLPPLTMVLFFPGAYLHALSYAGIICVILLLIMPALMAWQACRLYPNAWRVPGGSTLQLTVIFAGLITLIVSAMSNS